MRYTFSFKKKCLEIYRKGIWPKTPEGISEANFHNTILLWNRQEKTHGEDSLRHKKHLRKWTADEKMKLVTEVLEGKSYLSVAIDFDVRPGILHKWVQLYKKFGYNGLVKKKVRRLSKGDPAMKDNENCTPLSKAEREELERLRAQEAVRKKLKALSLKKEAARLKAKRQRLSGNFETKDTN